ncbi:MAG: hypothetical protein BZ138_07035 [Methanosphaera sp. rholeuAM270]|nr:MAG: hypothetical protein BZ138_07035 [Methanosphaera sp. rholeuAM270]
MLGDAFDDAFSVVCDAYACCLGCCHMWVGMWFLIVTLSVFEGAVFACYFYKVIRVIVKDEVMRTAVEGTAEISIPWVKRAIFLGRLRSIRCRFRPL